MMFAWSCPLARAATTRGPSCAPNACVLQEVKAGRSDGALMAALLDQAVTFLELCAHPEAHVCSAASLCVADLVAVFPAQVSGSTTCVVLHAACVALGTC